MRAGLLWASVAMTALTACQTKGTAPPVESRATLADSAEQVLFNTRSLLVDRGVQRGEMFADTVYVFDDNTRFELRKAESLVAAHHREMIRLKPRMPWQ